MSPLGVICHTTVTVTVEQGARYCVPYRTYIIINRIVTYILYIEIIDCTYGRYAVPPALLYSTISFSPIFDPTVLHLSYYCLYRLPLPFHGRWLLKEVCVLSCAPGYFVS